MFRGSLGCNSPWGFLLNHEVVKTWNVLSHYWPFVRGNVFTPLRRFSVLFGVSRQTVERTVSCPMIPDGMMSLWGHCNLRHKPAVILSDFMSIYQPMIYRNFLNCYFGVCCHGLNNCSVHWIWISKIHVVCALNTEERYLLLFRYIHIDVCRHIGN